MTDKKKEGGGHYDQTGQHEYGPHGGRGDVNEALLDVFRELLNRVNDGGQGRGLSQAAQEVVDRFVAFKAEFDMIEAIKQVQVETKSEPKYQQKGA